jgi:3-vinyl bacteriochlorophyllide hydratase
MFPEFAVGRWLNAVDGSPWGAAAGRAAMQHEAPPRHHATRLKVRFLYTPEQRRKRDETAWTMVQGVLAPVQFAVFLMSLVLVLRYLATGEGLMAATASIVVKTLVLYTIMITGAIWEKKVFGRYLFAPAFFWEDVFSMLVLGLHTAYLAALFSGAVAPRDQMLLALAGYTAYLVNATQFVMKLRAARMQEAAEAGGQMA